MKRVICILLLSCAVMQIFAQGDDVIKPPTLVFHAFYNDFNTAQQIRTSSLSNVLSNKLWSKLGDTQMGFGFNYIKGIKSKVDLTATLDGSSTDYRYKDGSTNGSSKFLLDMNAGLAIKLFTDPHPIVPYLATGLGFSLYQGKAGLYIPVGAGLQFNLFNEAFVFTHIQYRTALSSNVNDHFQYTIGIGTSIGKKKKTTEPSAPVIPVIAAEPVIPPVEVKDVTITVNDQQTGLPLPGVDVWMDKKLNGTSDANGRAVFKDVQTGDHHFEGTYNGINTTNRDISKSDFDITRTEISIILVHNDPRFTLTGTAVNKSTHQPEAGVTVSAINPDQTGAGGLQSFTGNGTFNIQLLANSDYSVSGKKAGFISNIEKVSTKGLDRSTTLYVKLELDIDEAGPDKIITLSNIYYDLGSAKIRPESSSDLEKLLKFLKDNPGIKIEIASHTDSRGPAAKNLKLSQARAQGVVNYLQINGIDRSRLIPKGYGATRLVNGCKPGVKCSEAQHEQNRRTELKVIDPPGPASNK